MEKQNSQTPKSFKVALIEPEIPSNTGNIGRTCTATKTPLELVEPLGFNITDRDLKRAGLDYWPQLEYTCYPHWADWLQKQNQKKLWFFSVRGKNSIYDCRFNLGDTLVFGKETKGLPKKLLEDFNSQTVRIPFEGPVRSLNLSNAVAIALFEANRQKLIR